SLTVTLHLVVMLPRHETPDALPADLRGRWESFVARVAAHEQRHVDIYLEGAKAMTARLEGPRAAVSCADLEKAIDAEWRAQQADIERAQTEFHAVDETTARSERESLQVRVDGTPARAGARGRGGPPPRHRARRSSASGRRRARGPRSAAQHPQRAAPRARG